MFVLDASVAISWCFPGEASEDTAYSRSVLRRLVLETAVDPEIWAFEIANNMYVSHTKRRRTSEEQLMEYLALLKALPIVQDSQPLWMNVDLESLARKFEIAAYDVAYLALAIRRKIPIATTDELLKQKARDQGLGVLL